MRTLLLAFFALVLFLGAEQISAQAATGNIVVVTKLELAFPEDFSNRELDSLTVLYNNEVTSKNEFIVDHKTVRHLWGNDNRDFIVIYSVKSFEDVEKANERNNELFRSKWTTKEERDAYNKAYNKYFTGKHSDEIYREVKFNPVLTSNE